MLIIKKRLVMLQPTVNIFILNIHVFEAITQIILGVGCLKTRCAKMRCTLKKDDPPIILPTYRVITRHRQQLQRGSEH